MVAGEGLPFDAMDEDESSEEDEEDEDALLPAEEHFALPAGALDGAGAGAAAGPAAAAGGGGAAAGGAHVPLVQGSAAETLLRAVSRRSTRARNRLRVPLTRPAGGNILLVKLINQVGMRPSNQGGARCVRLQMESVALPSHGTIMPIQLHPPPPMSPSCPYPLQENLMEHYGDPHTWCVQHLLSRRVAGVAGGTGGFFCRPAPCELKLVCGLA